ncbi:MAG: glycosyl hydrolase family 18 protein [Bacteroidetes bacterium]|nr:glycosyl hydrolase family 18 protein [Bacteroidota bacterium]
MKRNLLFAVSCILFVSTVFAQLPCNVMLGYYQTSWGTAVRLKDVNANYNVFALAFMEAGGGDQLPDNNTVDKLKLYSTSDANLRADILTVQGQGKKVLLSVGGASGSFKLTSTNDVNTFVSKMKTTIQSYKLDGMDLDMERSIYLQQLAGGTITSPEAHISNLISGLQQLLAWYQTTYSKKMILTMVPEVAYTTGGMSNYMSSTYGVAYLPIIEALRNDIDLVMVQLYNASGGSYGLDGSVYNQGTVDFIVSQTEAMIKGFTCKNSKGKYNGLKASQIAVCLPATSTSGGGYVSTTSVKSAINYLRGVGSKPGTYTLQKAGGYPGLRGMATWSVQNDLDGGYTFANNFATIFTSCLSTETDEIAVASALNLYPNPAADQLTVESELLQSQTLSIYNAFGQLVLQQNIADVKTILDISSLSSGFYTLSVGGEARKIVVE